jgi:hypothetical protein
VVHRSDATFLGVLKVDEADRERAAGVARRLAALAADPPPDWRRQREVVRPGSWKLALGRRAERAAAGAVDDDDVDERAAEAAAGEARALEDLGATPGNGGQGPRHPDEVDLGPDDQAEHDLGTRVAGDDAVALLLVGLVRDRLEVRSSRLRYFVWARPMTEAGVARAQTRLARRDEDRIRLNAAVKDADGFFTTFFVSPYSRFIARWCARRGFTPNQVTTFSMLLGLLAATAFATGERGGLVAGAVLLQVAFTFDCVDGQLARYTRRFSRLGAWLDSVFDRGKEYAVFAGLAIGAERAGSDVWVLACAALALQTARHGIDFAYPRARRRFDVTGITQPPVERVSDGRGPDWPRWLEDPASPRASKAGPAARPPRPVGARILLRWRRLVGGATALTWARKALMFPIGERFAAISLTAALFDPRVTFTVLLVWGGIALLYVVAGRLLRAGHRDRGATPGGAPAIIRALRDDGAVARALARFGTGLPAPPAASLLAVAGLAMAVALAAGGAPGTATTGAVVGTAVLVGGLSAGAPHDDRWRWAVPSLLRALEFGLIIWLAARSAAVVPAAFALLSVAAFRVYDAAYRARQADAAPPLASRLGLGWDGRLLLAWLLVALDAVPAGLYVAAAALGALLAGEAAAFWWGRRGQAAEAPAGEDHLDAEDVE